MIVKKELVHFVWEKGKSIPYRDEKEWRFDNCDALICFGDYGKQTEFGWEIDHIIPKTKGGSDDISNLQPLHWINNRHKSDGDMIPKVVARFGRNIEDRYSGIMFE